MMVKTDRYYRRIGDRKRAEKNMKSNKVLTSSKRSRVAIICLKGDSLCVLLGDASGSHDQKRSVTGNACCGNDVRASSKPRKQEIKGIGMAINEGVLTTAS